MVVNIVASQITNLKSLLKLINRQATNQRLDDDDQCLPHGQQVRYSSSTKPDKNINLEIERLEAELRPPNLI